MNYNGIVHCVDARLDQVPPDLLRNHRILLHIRTKGLVIHWKIILSKGLEGKSGRSVEEEHPFFFSLLISLKLLAAIRAILKAILINYNILFITTQEFTKVTLKNLYIEKGFLNDDQLRIEKITQMKLCPFL
ncbi:unnamed protein product [Lepeophtheirus salmonis]|uniref:(salmon louse) hypothetical protein n=1 Tax=Lepeophtheirus salmonis TaxID=72036 RepID=A0A7R8CFD9_LEPSM|nr:unnamed protein product [Lepeophtheirus salmonis]CAF2805464.1 unnamed protein product [Lepeophtheirus salmonis]